MESFNSREGKSIMKQAMVIKISAATALMIMLSACGTTQSDRAASGAGIGAGVGALGGAVAGGNIVGGAVVGGLAGGAVGALTNPHTVNLGTPLWRQ